LRTWFDTLAIFEDPRASLFIDSDPSPGATNLLDATIFQQLASGVDSSITLTDLNS
jgi:hypothetical protein